MVGKVNTETLQAIADAIRTKTGSEDPIKVKDFAEAIRNISGGDAYVAAGEFDVDTDISSGRPALVDNLSLIGFNPHIVVVECLETPRLGYFNREIVIVNGYDARKQGLYITTDMQTNGSLLTVCLASYVMDANDNHLFISTQSSVCYYATSNKKLSAGHYRWLAVGKGER